MHCEKNNMNIQRNASNTKKYVYFFHTFFYFLRRMNFNIYHENSRKKC